MPTIIDLLRDSELFSSLEEKHIKRIERIGQVLNYKAGEIIFEESSLETELYIILNGQVEIYFSSNSRGISRLAPENQTIISLWPGQSFGEIALVDDGSRTAGARSAVDGTRLFSISRRELLLLCNSYPEFGYRVMFNLATDLAKKFRGSGTRIRQSVLYGGNKQ